MATQNVLTTLKREHDQISDLFKKLKETGDRAEKTRGTLLEEILTGLIPHAKWEEEVFYPEFRKRADRDGQQTHAEAVEEHRAVERQVIPDVLEADLTTPEFAGRAKVFGEFVEHHAKEEEKTMFKMARELFSAEELASLDEEYANWKEVKGPQVIQQAMAEFSAR